MSFKIQREIKFEPKIKLNHNMYTSEISFLKVPTLDR